MIERGDRGAAGRFRGTGLSGMIGKNTDSVEK